MRTDVFYVYMSVDDEGNEAPVGLNLPSLGWVSVSARSEEELHAFDPLIEQVRAQGREVYIARFGRMDD